MGYTTIDLKLPPDFSPDVLRERVAQRLRLREFSATIERRSIDARDKQRIHWQVRVGVSSPELPDGAEPDSPSLSIPVSGRGRRAVVVGAGPAGFFCADILLRAGWEVVILEQGAAVEQRARLIENFESTGAFSSIGNYAFGEGGAGTFSDGKLTSRTKGIAAERLWIMQRYVAAGAPEEILCMAHPHLGTDNLRRMVKWLRQDFEARGGEILFETQCTDLVSDRGLVREVVCAERSFEVDAVVFAPGHSAHETFRMLMGAGVRFRPKSFAIGCRVEHPQALVNQAQWGRICVPGLKAAEYRLTMKRERTGLPAYTFCMCPGGTVVPAAAYAGRSVVNGMSRYARDGEFANSALVAAIDLEQVLEHQPTAQEALAWVDSLERTFHESTGSYAAPACRIRDFRPGCVSTSLPSNSFPLGLVATPLGELLPPIVSRTLAEATHVFDRKLKGFSEGVMIGLESKTSSPIQLVRSETGTAEGFRNLYVCGEGSGFAGGIVSSAVDGVRTALRATVAESFPQVV